MDIASNVKRLLEELRVKNVALVAVTKNQSPKKINEAIKAGVTIIGENRVQEAVKKIPDILPVEKHFIGRIQSNKIKKIVERFDCIQSVDKGKYLVEINKHAEKIGKIMPVLIEVNISGESQKGGIIPNEIMNILSSSLHLKHVKIIGLMGMAKETGREREIREEFSMLKNMFERVKKWDELPKSQVEMKYLSIGMTNDYKIAIEEGGNMVRVGRGVFG